MENKVRTIVADMLLNMNDKVTLTNRDLRQCQHELASFNMKINETNMKLDREAKIKDQVDALRVTIASLEKGMALDIENAVKNHDEVTFMVKKMSERVQDISQERSQFMLMQDKIRGQIADFENFLNETRGVHDR